MVRPTVAPTPRSPVAKTVRRVMGEESFGGSSPEASFKVESASVVLVDSTMASAFCTRFVDAKGSSFTLFLEGEEADLAANVPSSDDSVWFCEVENKLDVDNEKGRRKCRTGRSPVVGALGNTSP